MKMIVAVIRTHALDAVRSALTELGVEGMTAVEAKGFGRQKGHTEVYRGAEYQIDFVPKIRIEVVAADGQADQIVEAIAGATRSGKVGDGKIFVLPVDDAMRVRTGERGDSAV